MNEETTDFSEPTSDIISPAVLTGGMEQQQMAPVRFIPAEGPEAMMRRASEAAKACRDLVVRTSQDIQGKRFVRCEGWQAIATCFGLVASCEKVEAVEDGYRAYGVVRRISDGAIVATGEGFVGCDEPVWYGGKVGNKTYKKRPNYAIRAMAQTRSISRACRGPLSFVVVMMDADLEVTPAEEVPSGGFTEDTEPPPPWTTGQDTSFDEAVPAKADVPRRTPDPQPAPVEEPAWKRFPVPYGKNAGVALGKLPKNTLWGFWKNFNVQTEWNGKKISPEKVERSQDFRDALDAAGDYYGFTE